MAEDRKDLFFSIRGTSHNRRCTQGPNYTMNQTQRGDGASVKVRERGDRCRKCNMERYTASEGVSPPPRGIAPPSPMSLYAQAAFNKSHVIEYGCSFSVSSSEYSLVYLQRFSRFLVVVFDLI